MTTLRSLPILIGAIFAASLSCAAPATAPSPKPAAAADAARKIREVRAGEGSTVPTGTLLRTERYFVDADGRDVLDGPFVEWFPDGKKRIEGDYRHGLLDGPLVEWSGSTGKAVREERWKNGLQDGDFVEYDDDGKKTSACTYRYGKIVSPKRFFNRRGAVVREEVYDDKGELWEVTLWHANGARKLQGHFRGWYKDTKFLWGATGNMKKDGRWAYWDASGTLVAEGVFRDGMPWEGICGDVDRSSSLIVEHFGRYHEGKLVEQVKPPLPGL